MNCEAYEDIVAADVDGALGTDEAQAAQAHVASCPRCQSTRAKQQFAKTVLRERLTRQSVPQDLRERITAAIEAEPSNLATPLTRSRNASRRIMAGAIAALLAVGLYSVLRPTHPAVISAMIADAKAAAFGQLEVALQTSNVGDLATYYRSSGQIDFEQSVGDFSGNGFRLVGGSVDHIAGLSTTRSLYESADGKVVCRRFRAASVEIPAGGEQRGGRRVFTVDGVTFGIVPLGGGVVCILATTMPRDTFIRHLERPQAELSQLIAYR